MVEIKYGRGKFDPPQAYVDYINMIADSPVYEGLPAIRTDDGKINWQCSSGKTTSFYKYFPGRFRWWVEKADELGIKGTENSDDRLTVAARMIHPTKKKVCLVCGKERYVGYMYMNANYAKTWNKLIGSECLKKGSPVYEATKVLVEHLGKSKARKIILSDFPEKRNDAALFDQENYEEFFSQTQHIRSTKLSPGYMGDCPHRLDGIHDYCTFCRKGNDPGRSDANMRTYNHDRRAFMWWAEGDWKVADTLYNSAASGTCVNCGKTVRKISPDHIGPLSCGFKQNGFFEPLCGRCNSAKNRRFTFDNVLSLLDYEEKTGETVASWQVRVLWDTVKESVQDDNMVKILSNYMRAMQDYYLRALAYIASLGHYEFLSSYLHPEYAHYAVKFIGLNPSSLIFTKYKKTLAISNGSRSLAARSVRIAFEELFEYCAKTTAQRKSILLHLVDDFLEKDKKSIRSIFSGRQLTKADQLLGEIINSEDYSIEYKDGAIQKLIEAPEFDERFTRSIEFDEKFKMLIDKRGRNLAQHCLSEIQSELG